LKHIQFRGIVPIKSIKMPKQECVNFINKMAENGAKKKHPYDGCFE